MGIFKKYQLIFIIIGLITLYVFTRLYNILGLPIFTDEAIYIRWSQIALQDAGWRFISLTDGKQPMFIWIAMVLLKFIEDPLLAGRLVSVFAGAFTAIGIFFLTSELFKNKNISFLAAFLYIIYPFALVYDRIALFDSLVAMFMIWALYLEVLLVRKIRLDIALLLGMVIGAGMLTKSNAEFALILMPLSLLLFDFKAPRRSKRLFLWAIYSLIAVIVSQAIILILRLSPFHHIIGQKNHLFIYTFNEWISSPFASLFGNLNAFETWLMDYLSLPFIILIFASFIITVRNSREKVLIYLWFLIPLISAAFFAKLVYPRFLLFMTIPLLSIGAYALYQMMSRFHHFWQKSLILSVFIITFLINDYFIITDFKNSWAPQADKGQFITGWPSGIGVTETIEFLRKESEKKQITVGTQGTFGLMPYALEIYLINNPNITINGYWPVSDQPPEEVMQSAAVMPTYFVFYQECKSCETIGIAPAGWPVKKIFQIEKEEKGQFYTLYQINPL